MNARQLATLLGWIWISLGALAFMSGTGGFMMSLVMGNLPKAPSGGPFAASFLFDHYREGAIIQVFFAMFLIFTGFHFLKRRNWARIAVQVFSVLSILWLLFFGVMWIWMLWQMNAAPNGPSEGMLLIIRLVMTAGGMLAMLGPAVLFGLCIWALNRPSIRQEFRPERPSAQG